MASRVDVEHGLSALVEDARRLLVIDPDRFFRVLVLCRAYLAIHDRGAPPLAELLASYEMISPRKHRDSA